MSELYTYQVARIRCHEMKLLTKVDIDSLMGAKTYDECIRILRDKGIGDGTENSAEEILAYENTKLWDLMHELLKDLTPFKVILLPTDYNNLKAAIKSNIRQGTSQSIYKTGGMVDIDTIIKSVREHDFSILPDYMRNSAEKAYNVMMKSYDGQASDMILDKNCIENIFKDGKSQKDEILQNYAELTVALYNIKIAVRCQKTKKSHDFILNSMVDCKTLDIKTLAKTAGENDENLFSYLSKTIYSEGIELLHKSNSAFEKWCDDKIMALVKKQKSNQFGIGPLIAFVLARQTELSAIKIILSGKLNQLNDDMIRERLRDMYV